MKHNILKSGFALIAGGMLLFSTSCEKLEDFDDTNINPLGSTAPITGALITSAESALESLFSSTLTGGVRAGLYVQYFSQTQYTEFSRYTEPKFDFPHYAGSLMNLQVVIDRNSDPELAPTHLVSGSNANQIAIARILKAYYFWTLTDRWGDIPYSEALKGSADLFPRYDTQDSIYVDLFKELREAADQFDDGPKVVGDLIYNGEPANWKKLANTLRMLMAIRLTKVYPDAGQLAAMEFADAATDADGFIDENSENMSLDFPESSSEYVHPWYTVYDGRSDYGLSKTLADILTNMSDNRRDAFGTTGAPYPYGVSNEAVGQLPTSYATVLADGFKDQGSVLVIVNAASALLAHAEGIERGWVAGNAQQQYEDGIRASFDQWDVNGAETVISGAGNYETGTGGGTNIGANAFNSVDGQDAVTNNKLERIALQRYLAHFPDGIQGWAEWRRTGIPRLVPTIFNLNSNAGIPRRFVYGQAEYASNSANVTAAASRIGGDLVTSRMWWDRP